MGEKYQQFFGLVKHTWKKISMTGNTMTSNITRLCLNITANKEKDIFCSKTLAATDKY